MMRAAVMQDSGRPHAPEPHAVRASAERVLGEQKSAQLFPPWRLIQRGVNPIGSKAAQRVNLLPMRRASAPIRRGIPTASHGARARIGMREH
jgi:hypothetical protein